jgi:hypothetical protein
VPRDGGERSIDIPDVEPIGLEPPDPSAHVFELGVMRVEEQIEQPRIPLDTATVLWRG